jgi:hypothetical protein
VAKFIFVRHYNDAMNALFERDNGHYVPTEWSRGPWTPIFLHGGPPAALLAHILDAAREDPALLTSRLTIDLMRPVSFAPIRATTQVVRTGKRIRLVDAALYQDDQLVARASGLMLRRDPASPVFPPLSKVVSDPEGLEEFDFHAPDEPCFNRATEARLVRDAATQRIRAVWIRANVGLLPGQPLTPLEHAAAISDYTNATGSITTFGRAGFINADITLNVHRDPHGEWICLDCPGRPSQDGVAATVVVVHDTLGPLGSASTSCLANPVPLNEAGRPFGMPE